MVSGRGVPLDRRLERTATQVCLEVDDTVGESNRLNFQQRFVLPVEMPNCVGVRMASEYDAIHLRHDVGKFTFVLHNAHATVPGLLH